MPAAASFRGEARRPGELCFIVRDDRIAERDGLRRKPQLFDPSADHM
jgi:hypothetical protein